MLPPENFYANWRARAVAATLREGDAAAPPEKLLQAVWQHQRLLRDLLTTLDGRIVRVIHPGFKNREAGPDFRSAVIQFGDEPPRPGDVEIDLQSAGWHAHGHDRNPNFTNVILHVVWKRPLGVPASAGPVRLKAELPTLSLCSLLDAPLRELDLWLSGEPAEALPEIFRGRCSAPLRELTPGKLAGLLNQAAQVRLQCKAAWFQARARESGWEQALWEGLLRALGYKQNVWPLQRLAELRLRLAPEKKLSPLEWQARLLGVGGLLPAELTRTQASTDDYLKCIWNLWWRERDGFGDCILPRAAWKFNGLRPTNHPQRRLALAAHWLAAANLPAKLERWCTADVGEGRHAGDSYNSGPAARRSSQGLLKILQVERDAFWSWHWTLRSARLSKPQPLLGTARVTDLAVNVVLPWLWSRANEGKNESLQREIERLYFAWPAAEDNSLLKLARQRLLGGEGRKVFTTASAQQGLLQIVRDFCDQSDGACAGCEFPGLVRVWTAVK